MKLINKFRLLRNVIPFFRTHFRSQIPDKNPKPYHSSLFVLSHLLHTKKRILVFYFNVVLQSESPLNKKERRRDFYFNGFARASVNMKTQYWKHINRVFTYFYIGIFINFSDRKKVKALKIEKMIQMLQKCVKCISVLPYLWMNIRNNTILRIKSRFYNKILRHSFEIDELHF